MSRLDVLNNNLADLKNNLNVYGQEIDAITNKIKDVVGLLKDTNDLGSPLLDTTLANGTTDLSLYEKDLLSIANTHSKEEIIDYSVTMDDLSLKETIVIDGKDVNIYTSRKTDALYVISDGLGVMARNELIKELKNHLSDNQMSIVTFYGDCYYYDITGKNGCTKEYAVVGKTDQGKMYNIETVNIRQDKARSSEYVFANGRGNDTPFTIFNGMILANQMRQNMEAGAVLKFVAYVKDDTDGGQNITAFRRLTFSGGTHESTGSEYATVYMDGDYQQYAYNASSEYDDTKIYDEAGKDGNVDLKYLKRYVSVGDGPPENAKYTAGKNCVGHIDNAYIPFVVEAGNKDGSQRMQATLCYCFEGNRADLLHKNAGKSILKHFQVVYSDWNDLKPNRRNI